MIPPFVDTNLAKEVNRLRNREGTLWGGRYRSIPVSEEAAQIGLFAAASLVRTNDEVDP